MTEYHRISAWFNTEEWLRAYNCIYSEPTDRSEALNLLLIWKARGPFLPSGVESTLILLQVHVQDAKCNDDPTTERILRLAYSSAIMRFVNHMFDSETAKGHSLYTVAKYLNVPDWIVDLRHDTAHGNNLPTLELFRDATIFGFDWLRHNYWDKLKVHIHDFVVGQKHISTSIEEKIAVLINIFSSLSVCAHSKCKITNLAEIPNPSMKQSIVDDLQYLFRGDINLSKLKSVAIVDIVKKLIDVGKKLLNNKDMVNHMNKLLLGEDSLFLSIDLVNFMGSANFRRKKTLNNNYVQCFELLLIFLHTNDLLVDFLLELINISRCEDEVSSDRALLAALWLAKILAALHRCKIFMGKKKKMDSEYISSKTRNELKSLYHHWFPNENINDTLLLDLLKNVPSELTDINFIQPIISEYNPNLIYFIKDMLNLVEPAIPHDVSTKIYNLAQVISGTGKKNSKSSKIYTVDDLTSTSDHIDITEQMDIDDGPDIIKKNNTGAEGILNSIWKLAPKNHSWSTCPIGQLPWHIINIQNDSMNTEDGGKLCNN